MPAPIKVRRKTTVSPSASGDAYEMRLIFGAPAMGKSSLVDQYYRDAKAERRDIIIIDPQNAFDGYPERWWEGPAAVEDFMWSIRKTRRGLLILDDADLYLDASVSKYSVFRDLFVSFRHWGLDVVITSRRPQDIPKVATDNANYQILFNCRGWRTKEWLRTQHGPAIMKKVPREPYKYLFINVDTDETEIYSTIKREHMVEADSKV